MAGRKGSVWPDSVTRADLARLLGVSETMVGKWAKDHGLPRKSDGRFDLAAVVPWVKEKGAREAERGIVKVKLEDKEELQARKLKAHAMRAEVALGEELELLRRADEVDKQVARAVVQFRQQLEGLPATLSGKLAQKSTAEVSRELERTVQQIMEDLRRAMQEEDAEVRRLIKADAEQRLAELEASPA